jgi:septal ring factor EnvC (AmiA/AmiB activator)
MANNEDPTRRFESAGNGGGRTLDDLFEMMQSLRNDFDALRTEFTAFRDKVDARLLKITTPLSETLEAIRVDIRAVTESQDASARETAEMRSDIADIKKVNRRIETKFVMLTNEFYEFKANLHDHEVRLEALEPD